MYSETANAYMTGHGKNEGRVILHADLNNFFASVECLKHRALRGYPVAVCGRKEERHGIVLAKNNLAKAAGVQTAQRIGEALAVCPELVILPPHFDEYLAYSKAVRHIYEAFSDRVESFGMDEAWIELTGHDGIGTLSDGVKTANDIRKAVYEATGLTLSVGVSDNKTFAKLASDYRKPDAVTLFGPAQYHTRVAPLPIGDMLFAGGSTVKRLKQFGIGTIGDVSSVSEEFMRNCLGKNGVSLYRAACGHDTDPVAAANMPDMAKSVGNSATPPRDMAGEDDIRSMIYALADKVCIRLRKLRAKATVLAVSVRDTDLAVTERQCRLTPTSNADVVAVRALSLYREHFDMRTPTRSMGLRLTGLIDGALPCQSDLFEESEEKAAGRSRLDDALDSLRAKYGSWVVERARFIEQPIAGAVFATASTGFARQSAGVYTT